MSTLQPGACRQQLDVSTEDLEHAADAVASALGVYAAKVAASLGSRASALKLLKGRDVLRGTQERRRGSVIRKRVINIAQADADDGTDSDSTTSMRVRPKRRSGRYTHLCNMSVRRP